MAINDIPLDRQPDLITSERVLPESTPTDVAMALLESWRDDESRGLRASRGDVLARFDYLFERFEALRDETAGLRYALTSRSTIDGAKGILRADRGCDADEAFEILARLSMDTNVSLRDVAGAVVYKASADD
jgi:hypothetical protein